jgi:hypothetical protein
VHGKQALELHETGGVKAATQCAVAAEKYLAIVADLAVSRWPVQIKFSLEYKCLVFNLRKSA